MLACASSNLEALLELIIKDDTLINRKGFLHGVSTLVGSIRIDLQCFMQIVNFYANSIMFIASI